MDKLQNLKRIYLNGDIGEFASVSSHPKHPTTNKNLLYEIDYMNVKFDELQKRFPGIPVTFIAGNHCHRVFRYIRDIAPEMWGLVDCPSLLKFPKRKWKYVEYTPNQWVQCGDTKLWIRHEPLSGGMMPAKGTAETAYVDCLFGHVHTEQKYTHKKHGPVPYITRAYAGGWLGDVKHPVFDYRGPRDRWVHGFSVIASEEKCPEYEYKFVNL